MIKIENLTDVEREELSEIVVQCYAEVRDVRTVAENVGLSVLDTYSLIKHKKLSIADRVENNENTSKLGAQAEQEFQRLVPFAHEINAINMNNPGYDFVVGDYTIDVKCSTKHVKKCSRSGNETQPYWRFNIMRHWQTTHEAEFYVLLALHEKEMPCDYDLYIIPAELVVGSKVVTINVASKAGSHWSDFLVSKDKAAVFFKELQGIKKVDARSSYEDKHNKKSDFYQIEVKQVKKLNRKLTKQLEDVQHVC